MLKTNSKKARDNVRAYITDCFTPDNYIGYLFDEAPTTFEGIAAAILSDFHNTMDHELRFHGSVYNAFVYWCSGLPEILDTCYYYNRSAVDDLAAILEETPEEAAKYSESDAESVLTLLIYRELTKGDKK